MVDGAIRDLAAGKRILLLAQNHRMSQRHFDDIARRLDDIGLKAKTRRTNGQERIDLDTGGSIAFRSTELGARGYQADVIIVDATAAHSERWRDMIAGTQPDELILY